MENLLSSFTNPSIIDLKVGHRTYPVGAEQDKIDYELYKYPRQSESGFRMVGSKVFNEKTGEYTVLNKRYGQSIPPERVKELLLSYLNPEGNSDYQILLKSIIGLLSPLVEYFKIQKEYNFTASSVFIAYEKVDRKYNLILKLIDFYYAYNSTDIDDNTLYGLEKLLESFINLVK